MVGAATVNIRDFDNVTVTVSHGDIATFKAQTSIVRSVSLCVAVVRRVSG